MPLKTGLQYKDGDECNSLKNSITHANFKTEQDFSLKIVPPSSGEVGFHSEICTCFLWMWKHFQSWQYPTTLQSFFIIPKLITQIAHDDTSWWTETKAPRKDQYSKCALLCYWYSRRLSCLPSGWQAKIKILIVGRHGCAGVSQQWGISPRQRLWM